jgi:hypothetical protein
MITALLIIVGATLVIGSAIMLLSLAEAPDAYEDVAGFHFGAEPEIGENVLLASPVTEYRDDVLDAGFAETQTKRDGACAEWPSLGLRQRSHRASAGGIRR